MSGTAPPFAGNSQVWFYANLTLTQNVQATACPDLIHLYVDTAVNPPVLREQTISDANPATDAPPSCVYGTLAGTYTGVYQNRSLASTS